MHNFSYGKTGLVLEGGAMRGMYTAGVLDVFIENGISFDGVIGVSAGALFGVNLLSGQKGRVLRYNQRFNQDKNYMGIRPLLREGAIVSPNYAYDVVPRKLDPFDEISFRQSGVPFFAVVTRMDNGQAEAIHIENVFDQMDVLRASGSMPFVSQPVVLNGKKYLDGGVSDSIPFERMADLGYPRLVVVLTRDMEYRKKPMNPALIRMFYRKYPAFCKQLENRHIVYNRSIELLKTWESQGRVFIIRPSVPLTIRKMEKDPQKLAATHELGVKDAQQMLPSLRRFLTGNQVS